MEHLASGYRSVDALLEAGDARKRDHEFRFCDAGPCERRHLRRGQDLRQCDPGVCVFKCANLQNGFVCMRRPTPDQKSELRLPPLDDRPPLLENVSGLHGVSRKIGKSLPTNQRQRRTCPTYCATVAQE